jgi:hypothetical protein
MTCKYCGGETTEELQLFANGTKHIKIICVECGRFQQFKQRVDDSDFVMPFGKYKGKTISEIIKDDRQYAIWVSEKVKSNNVKRRFKAILEQGLCQ